MEIPTWFDAYWDHHQEECTSKDLANNIYNLLLPDISYIMWRNEQ